MNCRQIDDLILDYCENTLPEDLMNEISDHIKQCPFCGNNEKWTRLENDILQKTVITPVLPDDFCLSIMQKLETRDELAAIKNDKARRKTLFAAFSSLAVAAAILLVIIAPAGLQNDKIPLQVAQVNNATQEKAILPGEPLEPSKSDIVVQHDVSEPNEPTESTETANTENKQKVAEENTDIPSLTYSGISRDIKAGSRAFSGTDKMLKAASPSGIPVPAGIPSQYHLVKSVVEDTQATYFYSNASANPGSNISFAINVCESGPETGIASDQALMDAPMSIASKPSSNNRTMECAGKTFVIELAVLSPGQNSEQLLNSILLIPPANGNHQ
ncbi:MAG TPA: hypothetical protein DER33_04125 [Syntrophomonas sp.]|jgi:hypothetical protein|nr:hypothetical protein [Syntrophomonas sp.]HCF70768.1 hypothetical protein [Syntrophomonas sp.]